MTAYEFVFFLYAIMLALGLTHLVGGWAMVFRNAGSIRWSLPPALWSLAVLFLTIGNLNSFWLMRDAANWNAWLVLSNFAFATIDYVCCVFVTPDAARGEQLDLAAFHESERKRYLGALVALAVIALASNVANGIYAAYDNWIEDSISSMAMIVPVVVAIFWNNRIVQLVTAGFVSVLSFKFMIEASFIVGT